MKSDSNLSMQGKFGFKISLRNFADHTTIHGFRDFYYSKSLIMQIFWAVVLSGALCLTVYHISQSVINYQSQPTMITFETVSQKEMRYPDLMICYPHWIYWLNWTQVERMGFSRQETLVGMSHLSTIYSRDYFDRETAQRGFVEKMARNNFTTLSEFYKVSARISPNRLYDYSDRDRRILNFDLKFLGKTGHLCYVVPGVTFFNFTPMDLFEWGFRLSIAPRKRMLRNEPIVNQVEYDSYLSELYSEKNEFNPQDEYLLVNDKYQDMIVLSPNVNYYVITVTAHVKQWTNKRHKPCTSSSSLTKTVNVFNDECRLKCVCRLIYEPCRNSCTISFAFAALIQRDYPTMGCAKPIVFLNRTDERLARRKNEHQTGGMDAVCRNFPKVTSDMCDGKCVPKCRKWNIERSVNVIDNPPSTKQPNAAIIELHYPRSEDVILMLEVDSLTWDRLIADIGGLLGIWLGASLVSFVQLFYQCCCNASKLNSSPKSASSISLNNNVGETLFPGIVETGNGDDGETKDTYDCNEALTNQHNNYDKSDDNHN